MGNYHQQGLAADLPAKSARNPSKIVSMRITGRLSCEKYSARSTSGNHLAERDEYII
jgi:hypothetical protein